MKELISIQYELNAPKSNTNKFGNYNYRSTEDILSAVKPLLHKYECFLNLSDEIVLVGDRYYVKATARIMKDGITISVSALAREEESQKGMSSAQLTGSTSSYARKYALNGLFAIDDEKDDDTKDNTTREKTKTVDSPTGEKKQYPRTEADELLEQMAVVETEEQLKVLFAKLYPLGKSDKQKSFYKAKYEEAKDRILDSDDVFGSNSFADTVDV